METAVEQLVPEHRPRALDDLYGDLDLGDDGRWVACNMVASVDGAVTLDGVSGGLGGEGDRAGFRALRGRADVVVAGAGTVRAEGYGPPPTRQDVADARRARGQPDRPALAVITRSLDLSGGERLFRDESFRPYVLTVDDAPVDRREALVARGARVLTAGTGDVDPVTALDLLAADGLTGVLVEGGPALNARFLAAGVVDHLFVTVAPLLVGGDAGRIVRGALPASIDLELVQLHRHASELLLHYRIVGRR